MPSKKDGVESHRAEVEQLSKNGQTCEQIAAVLRTQGLEISAKTISRYRVSWGIRQRAEPKTKGRKYPDRRKNTHQPSKHEQQEARKAEIIARTQQGETAEQIAAAFGAQGISETFAYDHPPGIEFSKSTLTRLQTYWGLIPYDNARARGRYSDKENAKRAERESATKTRKPRQSRVIAAPANPAEVHHYPSECAFGPDKRIAPMLQNPFNQNPPFDAQPDSAPLPDDENYAARSPYPMERAGSSVNGAADLMSAEMLLDLATSTLAAANRVKELYVAQQAQRTLPGMTTIPTGDDIAMAKQKVREAAAVMHDLATPNDT